MKCTALLVAILAIGTASCAKKPARPAHLDGLTAYCTQLHLHGLTNHNGPDQPASMQWHSHFARETGVDVIWWTDHYHGFDLAKDYRFNLRPGRINPRTLEITNLDLIRRLLTRLVPDVTGGTAEVQIQDDRLAMSLRARDENEPDRFLYYCRSELGRIRSTSWVRPVSSGLEFRGDLQVDEITCDGDIEIEAHLAWHMRQDARQDTLLFRFSTRQAALHSQVVNDHRVLVELPLPENWEIGEPFPFALDLLEPASLLEWGDDNTLSELGFGVAASRGAEIGVTFSNLRLHSRNGDFHNQIRAISRFASRYQDHYGGAQHVGVEFGDRHTVEKPHMDAHFPGLIPQFDVLRKLYQQDLSAWVAAVHDAGGIVTLNHIFGAGLQNLGDTAPARTARIREVTQKVLAHDAHGADLFEAGYLMRAGGTLRDHLHVWDILLANGYRIYGDATSDCHGGPWGVDMLPNPMVSWIWAEGTDPVSLLSSMRAGRLFFGNPFLWSGELTLWAEGGWMGDEIAVRGNQNDLSLFLSPLPPNAEVFLVQGQMGSGTEVSYLHERTPVSLENPFSVSVSDPSFARVEVYGRVSPDSLTPLVFSNPIFLYPETKSRPSESGGPR